MSNYGSRKGMIFMAMKEILNKYSLTPEEKAFADRVAQDLGYDGNIQTSTKAQVFATLYLSKQLEESSKSSDKSAKAMNLLTAVIAIFTLFQVIIAIIK